MSESHDQKQLGPRVKREQRHNLQEESQRTAMGFCDETLDVQKRKLNIGQSHVSQQARIAAVNAAANSGLAKDEAGMLSLATRFLEWIREEGGRVA